MLCRVREKTCLAVTTWSCAEKKFIWRKKVGILRTMIHPMYDSFEIENNFCVCVCVSVTLQWPVMRSLYFPSSWNFFPRATKISLSFWPCMHVAVRAEEIYSALFADYSLVHCLCAYRASYYYPSSFSHIFLDTDWWMEGRASYAHTS